MIKTETKTLIAKTDCTDCDGTGTNAIFGGPCDCLHTPRPKKAVKMASPNQIGFLIRLVDDRSGSDNPAVKLAEARLAGTAALTKAEASTLIDALTTVAVTAIRSNGYAKACKSCGIEVAAGAGRIEKSGGTWLTFHLDGDCPTPEVIAEIAADKAAAEALKVTEPGMYKVGDDIYKVRWNMGKSRLYALQLVNDHGHIDFHYDREAMNIIRAEHALTAAEAHAFGASFNTCVNCLKDLTDDKSVVAKYGATCAKNLGWRYPTKKEADAVLAGDLNWADILTAA